MSKNAFAAGMRPILDHAAGESLLRRLPL